MSENKRNATMSENDNNQLVLPETLISMRFSDFLK